MAPLYEYACPKCQTRFEERVSRHDSPAPPCPQCGEKNPLKQLSRFAVAGQGDLRESTLHGCHGPHRHDGDNGHGH
ncbi:MAG: FmdB family zinc ribbon protein [Oligoflexia bacterium]